MKYRFIWWASPQNSSQRKLYETPLNDGMITEDEWTKEIADMSSLSRGGDANVVDSITEVIHKYLLIGHSISFGDMGTLRLSLGSEDMDDNSTDRNKQNNINVLTDIKLM
jgi:predicted histone-like DNA-binding protein